MEYLWLALVFCLYLKWSWEFCSGRALNGSLAPLVAVSYVPIDFQSQEYGGGFLVEKIATVLAIQRIAAW